MIHVAVAAIEVAPARYLAKKGIKARHVLSPVKKTSSAKSSFFENRRLESANPKFLNESGMLYQNGW
jgi:hypothetical protein